MRRSREPVRRTVAAIGGSTLMLVSGVVPTAALAAEAPSDHVSVFASVGHHGTGVAVHRGLVYVSTSDAVPLGMPRTDDEHVLTYDGQGRLIRTLNVDPFTRRRFRRSAV